jgi:nucleotide-binding universal stress UspA family protein
MRILVATDLNDDATLIPHAVAQAKKYGALVTLVHAIQPSETVPLQASGVYISPAVLEDEIGQALKAMAKKVEADGVSCDWIARPGFAADVVQEVIESTGATRLIMATHGRGKLGQFLLGSVARQLLGRVGVPIFAVGPRCSSLASHTSPRRILHPVSMNGNYRRNVEIAIELARFHHAQLILQHVPDPDVESSISPGCTLAWAENLFAELLPGGAPAGVPDLQVSIAFGDRVRAIRDEAARTDADWIVVGVDEEPPQWSLSDCMAYRLLGACSCPVLAIRREFAPKPEAANVDRHGLIAVA